MNTRTPCSPPAREPLYEKARGLIDTCLDASASAGADLSVTRAAVLVAVSGFQEMVVGAATQATMSEAIPWQCPRCHTLLAYHDTQGKKVVFPEGVADYERGRYRCGRCGEEYVPADELNDLEQTGYTLDAREVLATEAAGESYRSTVEEVGPELAASRQTVARVVSEVAGWHKEEQEVTVKGQLGDRDQPGEMPSGEGVALSGQWQEKELPQGAAFVLSMDGGKVRSNQHKPDGDLEWKEGRVATGMVVAAGEQLPREKAGGKLYLGRVLSAEKMMEILAVAYLLLPGWLRALPLAFVADGGPWWEWVGVHFPQAIQILDIFHAGEHCTQVAAVCYAPGSARLAQYRQHIRDWLRQPGGLEAVIADLYRHRPSQLADPKGHHEVLKLVRYLREHRHRMRYWEYEAKGLPIGSGCIESAVDQVMAERLRRSGMKWNVAHADDMMCLRAAVLSGELPAIIARRKAACRQRIQCYLEPLRHAA